MVLYEPQEFGGLEEYAATLAIGLHDLGHQVSVLSTTWTAPENQYLRRLHEGKVTVVQLPKWLSWPASNWSTKMRILATVMWLASPLVYLLAGGLCIQRRCPWGQALASAQGWLQRQLLDRVIAPDRREPLARLLLAWWRWRWRPDLLHIQGYTRTLLFVIDWAHDHRIPVVYEEHQTPDAQFDWWEGFQQSINKADTVVAVSDKSAQALRSVCGVTRPIVVRSPLLPDPLASGPCKDVPLPGAGRPIRVTTVARLVVAKGLTYLLDAIALVRATHARTEFRVYGDGPLRDELLAYASRLGLDGPAIFAGAFTTRQELTEIMGQTDIYVMSSILEGQPLGVVEAMAYGCPIVTTAVGGIPELIEDGVNGQLCQPKDPECLASHIRTLIDNPALRARLGSAARKAYERGPYQPSAVSSHLVAVYQDVLRQRNSRALTHLQLSEP